MAPALMSGLCGSPYLLRTTALNSTPLGSVPTCFRTSSKPFSSRAIP